MPTQNCFSLSLSLSEEEEEEVSKVDFSKFVIGNL